MARPINKLLKIKTKTTLRAVREKGSITYRRLILMKFRFLTRTIEDRRKSLTFNAV